MDTRAIITWCLIVTSGISGLTGCHHRAIGYTPPCVCLEPEIDTACPPGPCLPCRAECIDHICIPLPPVKEPIEAHCHTLGDWHLSAREAVCTAMRNSNVVRIISNENTIAASTTADPAIAEAQERAALGVFDTTFTTSMFWRKLDNPPGQTFGGFARFPNLDFLEFQSELAQPLLHGGRVGTRFDTNYLFVPPPQIQPDINPQYQPELEVFYDQPLLRGFGKEVNLAPIAIARVTSQQSAWEFKQSMLAMVRSVEQAYWELYAAERNLESINSVLPLYDEVVRVQDERIKADQGTETELAQARAEMYGFREEQIAARAEVERQGALLRNIMGLPPGDCRKIVLVDAPQGAPISVNWSETLNLAMRQRPDVVRQRLAVHAAELEAVLARDATRARLDAQGVHRINGLGNDFRDALEMLGDNRFSDWEVGFTMEVPLQNRAARGNYRAAQYEISRERFLLDQVSHAATHELAQIFRDLESLYDQYQVAEQRQRAYRTWLVGSKARFSEPPPGITLLQVLDNYLETLRGSTIANRNAANVLARYNTTLARLDEAKGVLLDRHCVMLLDDRTNAAAEKIEATEPSTPKAIDYRMQKPQRGNASEEPKPTEATESLEENPPAPPGSVGEVAELSSRTLAQDGQPDAVTVAIDEQLAVDPETDVVLESLAENFALVEPMIAAPASQPVEQALVETASASEVQIVGEAQDPQPEDQSPVVRVALEASAPSSSVRVKPSIAPAARQPVVTAASDSPKRIAIQALAPRSAVVSKPEAAPAARLPLVAAASDSPKRIAIQALAPRTTVVSKPNAAPAARLPVITAASDNPPRVAIRTLSPSSAVVSKPSTAPAAQQSIVMPASADPAQAASEASAPSSPEPAKPSTAPAARQPIVTAALEGPTRR